jgi:hypothetical protein
MSSSKQQQAAASRSNNEQQQQTAAAGTTASIGSSRPIRVLPRAFPVTPLSFRNCFN